MRLSAKRTRSPPARAAIQQLPKDETSGCGALRRRPRAASENRQRSRQRTEADRKEPPLSLPPASGLSSTARMGARTVASRSPCPVRRRERVAPYPALFERPPESLGPPARPGRLGGGHGF